LKKKLKERMSQIKLMDKYSKLIKQLKGMKAMDNNSLLKQDNGVLVKTVLIINLIMKNKRETTIMTSEETLNAELL
jgi:hypothetical protein